jgi:hypothetical protein
MAERCSLLSDVREFLKMDNYIHESPELRQHREGGSFTLDEIKINDLRKWRSGPQLRHHQEQAAARTV